MDRLIVAVIAVVFVSASARAADAPIVVHGWIDGYYAWNGNHPDPKVNWFEGVGTTAHRADEPALNVAALELIHDPKPFGVHLVVVAGDSADVVHAGEPHPHRHPIRNLYQASISYAAPVGRGLQLEAGVYPSHIGFEGFFSKDNWNYTRGWLGEFSPFYQTGIKASYAWSSKWSGQVHLMRGWQLIGDNNSAPAIGTQLAYDGGRLSGSLNTFIGPELPHDNTHLRTFGDLIGSWKATAKLTVAASLDRGRQDYPGSVAANWLGVSAWARYAFDDRHAVAARADRFRDPNAGISGFPQTLTGATLTYEVHPVRHLILKLEGRRDHSTARVFAGSNDETLALLGGVLVF